MKDAASNTTRILPCLWGVKHTVMWQIPRPVASEHRIFFSHLSGISFLNEVFHKPPTLFVKVLISLRLSFLFLKTVVLLLPSPCCLAAKEYHSSITFQLHSVRLLHKLSFPFFSVLPGIQLTFLYSWNSCSCQRLQALETVSSADLPTHHRSAWSPARHVRQGFQGPSNEVT